MRQVVLDTETTGLEVLRGHRVVEIGCVELLQRRRTGNTFHCYLNPDRAMDEGARAVTGLSDEFLAEQPRFEEVAGRFLDFIEGAEIVAHNASFDIGFLDAELARAGLGAQHLDRRVAVLDTLALARERFPGQRNSLDALCRRLDVDNGGRDLHGALLDANLLTDVYLALTAGQGQLGFDAPADDAERMRASLRSLLVRPRLQRASEEELARHLARLERIEVRSHGACLWLHSETDPGA